MSIIPKELRTVEDPIRLPAPLKLKGRKLYRGSQEVAEVRGCREWVKGTPHGEFAVWQNGEKLAWGFCYFADAVKWAKSVIGEGRQ